MILHLHRQTFVMRIKARAFMNCPAFQYAIQFQTEIIMQMRCSVFLDEIAVTFALFDKRFWFRRFRKITLGFVCF